MATSTEILKQFKNLVRNITSFSDEQAKLSEEQPDEDSMTIIRIAITPNDGHYKDGIFEFEIDISDGYPESNPPKIRCLTKVYHPNIDQIDEYSAGDICLNLQDELWTPTLTLEDYVQGLLFLMHNPNFEDPLNSAFNGSEDEEEIHRNIRLSMTGKEVDGFMYENVLPDGYVTEIEDDEKDKKDSDHETQEYYESLSADDTIPAQGFEEEEESELEDDTATQSDATFKLEDSDTQTTSSRDEATGQQETAVVPVKPVYSTLLSYFSFTRFSRLSLRQFLNEVFTHFQIFSVTFFVFRIGFLVMVPLGRMLFRTSMLMNGR